MKTFFTTLLVSSFLATVSAYAQKTPARVREVGLRTNGFNDLGMIYKKQIGENTYRRYRAAFGNVSATFQGPYKAFSLSVGGAAGKEKRKNLTEKLQAVYGAELIASLGISSIALGQNASAGNRENYQTISPTVGVGLVMGAQYNFSPRWYVSTELNPSLTVAGNFSEGISNYSINAGFNSSSVGITGAYRF